MMAITCPKCNTENTSDSQFCKKCATPLPLEKIIISRTKTFPSKTDEPIIGAKFAERYLITDILGRGGMGKVFKALDMEINENVALKVLNPDISSDKHMIERFRNELKFARRISHKNVCRMHDLSKEGETYFINMEYVPGQDLKSILRRVGPFSPSKAIIIAKQVCEGLNAAHELGIIHRDLKPHNIMIDMDGNVRIMDFGIARSIDTRGLTTSGVMIGTPDYMSPEQVDSEKADLRSDIYSLGIIVYELVTGIMPFKGDSAISIALKHKIEVPKNPRDINAQIPKELSELILKCLEKNRENRYKSTKELLSELNAIEKRISEKEKAFIKHKPRIQKKRIHAFRILGILFSVVLVIVGSYLVYNQFLKGENGRREEKIPIIPETPTVKAKELTSQNGIFEVNSVPEGAEVYLDNKLKGVTPLKSDFLPGEYKILVRKAPGYKEVTDILKISSGETSLKNYILTPQYLLIINSSPESADVKIDGKYIGKTPAQIELPKSECQLVLEKGAQWTKIDEQLTLNPGRNVIQRSLERIRYSLFIKTDPTGARVFIDNNPIGTSPIKKSDLFGELNIKIEKDGFTTIEDSIIINSDTEKTYNLVKVELKASESEGEKKEDLTVTEQTTKALIEKEPIDQKLPKKQTPGITFSKRPYSIALEFFDMWMNFGWIDLGRGSREIPYPFDIATDKSNHVYVTDRRNKIIYIFTNKGNSISYIKTDEFIANPTGIAIDNTGYIYVCDSENHRIVKCNSEGDVVRSYGKNKGDVILSMPSDIAIDDSNNLYVCDSGNHRIVKYNSEGDIIREWGSYGKNKGEFNSPMEIDVFNSKFVFVVDRGNSRIQKYSSDGAYIGEFGASYKVQGYIKLKEPAGIAVDNVGYVYVSDRWRHKIFIFTVNGDYINVLGSKGKGNGEFTRPCGIAIDDYGYVYVADMGNNRIQKFKIK